MIEYRDKLIYPEKRMSPEFHAGKVKREFDAHLIKGIEAWGNSQGYNPDKWMQPETVATSLLVLKSSLYHAIYFLGRTEALTMLPYAESHQRQIEFLSRVFGGAGVNRMMNYAVASYVGEANEQGRLVKTNKVVPPNAFQAYDDTTLAARPQDFTYTKGELGESTDDIYDLHDLSHVLATRHSDTAFRSRYHEGLSDLPFKFKDLIYSNGSSDATGCLYSDGIVLGELSRGLYDQYEKQGLPSHQIEDRMAIDLAQYLEGKKALLHPGIGRDIKLDQPPTLEEVAVLAQNKRYERQASEYEYFLFVRGPSRSATRSDPKRDPMFFLSNYDRIRKIASLDDRVYFEQRNVSRNRAQEQAYKLFAQERTGDPLAQSIMDSIDQKDLAQGKEINLYQEVKERMPRIALSA